MCDPFDFNNIKTTDFSLFNEKFKFTDDTVMTVAVYAPPKGRGSRLEIKYYL